MFTRFGLSLALLFLLPSSGTGQVVLGQLLNGETKLPLEGAMVTLEGTQGEVDTVLSNASGRFLLRATVPGNYAVRADRIGHASTRSDSFPLAQGDTIRIQLVAEIRAIELEGLEVTGEARCDVRPEAGRAVAVVWEEARKALAAAALTEDVGYYRYRTIRFLRELDEKGRRVLSEQRRASQGYLLSPFESLPAETLVAEGFMKPDPEGDLYYAPDARVLLSEPFLDTHCLGLQPGRGENSGLLGVGFEPIPGRTLPDIRGVLWVDPVSGELKHVDYTYENLDPGLRSDMVGGKVAFQGLPNGTWIVNEWRIRMPNAAVAPDYRGGRQMILAGIREVGGQVDRVQDQRGATILEAQRATLTGVVLDSTGVNPLPGARVAVRGTQASVVTDAEGGFTLPGLSEGVYSVGFSHPTTPDLGGPNRDAEVALTPGEITSVTLLAPPLSSVLSSVCGEDRPQDSAVLTGLVLDGDTGAPLAGATVRVLWTDFRFRGTEVAGATGGRWRTLMGMQEDGLQGETDQTGRYLACSVPSDHPVTLEAETGGRTSGALVLRIPPDQAVLSHDLSLVEAGIGSVVGQVVDWQDQRPLEGVRVTLSHQAFEAITNEEGRFAFREVPLGRHILEAEMLGRRSLTDTVQVRADQELQLELRLPTQALEIEGVSVEVLSRREMDFRREGFSGGRFDNVTPEEMDEIRDRVTDMVDIIRSMGSPRIRVTETNAGGVPLGLCIRWTRREISEGGALQRNAEASTRGTSSSCTNMLIVLDGMPIQDVGGGGPTIPATEFLMDLSPEDVESVRVLSPVQARFQFGAQGDRGALVIVTRRGGGAPSEEME